jgi:cell division protein FtsB
VTRDVFFLAFGHSGLALNSAVALVIMLSDEACSDIISYSVFSSTLFFSSKLKVTFLPQTLMSIFPNSDDEVVIYTLEQALVLILVIGRWLLPKGSLSRDQLSQLLLVYVGVAADIIEFTEIIKEDEIRNAKMLMNKHFVNAVILFWSVSLFQFTLTISVTERSAQRIEKEKAQLEEEIKKLKELERARKRNQIAPALYTYKRSAPQQKVEEIKLKYIHTRYGLEIEPDTQGSLEDDPEKGMDSTRDQRGYRTRFKEYLVAFGSKCQGYVELVILLIPLIMQDGPYLTIRLIAIAYYDVSHSTLYFLTVKNALVVMLQVYRIFVLYYKPPDDADDVSEFDHSARLTNVQTAIKGVQHARLAIRLVTRLQKQARWHKAGRTYNDIKKTDTPPGLQI